MIIYFESIIYPKNEVYHLWGYKYYLNSHNRIQKLDTLLAMYRGAGMSLAQPGRKQATATEDFEFHISYLQSQLEEY